MISSCGEHRQPEDLHPVAGVGPHPFAGQLVQPRVADVGAEHAREVGAQPLHALAPPPPGEVRAEAEQPLAPAPRAPPAAALQPSAVAQDDQPVAHTDDPRSGLGLPAGPGRAGCAGGRGTVRRREREAPADCQRTPAGVLRRDTRRCRVRGARSRPSGAAFGLPVDVDQPLEDRDASSAASRTTGPPAGCTARRCRRSLRQRARSRAALHARPDRRCSRSREPRRGP